MRFFQPIVDTASREVFGHESLVRLESDRCYNGGEIIETAIARGDVHVFDSYARGTAIRQSARQNVPKYREQNFRVALDDIGTGSNSLQMMAELQPDFIKLDKSLVWNIGTPIGRNTIVKLAELATDAGIQTIAEGVETAEMRDSLINCGVTLMQGYFFGKPAPQPRTSLPDSVYGPMTTALLPA